MSDNSVMIIAEAGVNHNGSVDLALKMIDKAYEAGADYIKFQTFKASSLVSCHAKKARYQVTNTKSDGTQLSMLEKLELSFDDFIRLKEHCEKVGIGFMSTPFDLESALFLNDIGLEIFKVGSGDINNKILLDKIASFKKEVILSTGMSDLYDIDKAMSVLEGCKVSLLHCTTEYPCPYESVNMQAMQTLKDRYDVTVGYSDHTRGLEIAFMAVAMGARIIEKHFTLDRNMEGPDQISSLQPDELKAMVLGIRHIQMAFGDGKKHIQQSEIENIKVARKSLVASRDIKKGELLSMDNICAKRPGSGISPMDIDKVLFSAAIRDFSKDDLIEI